jgi:lipopolysaccharide/colanic/teichoic acid biosynthesis glycosyltransferase
MDIITTLLTLLLLSPLFFVIAFAIAITSGKPIFFRHWRVGQHGRKFQVQKFRTMRAAAEGCIGVTQDGDHRITSIGRWLRRWKLDELPQLYNVLKGEMTLVGPRPDLEEFWLRASAAERRILELKPGLTGAASVAFHDEEWLLAKVSPERLASFYIEQVLPQKAKLDGEYAAQATFRSDCGILLQTLLVPFLQERSVTKQLDELPFR